MRSIDHRDRGGSHHRQRLAGLTLGLGFGLGAVLLPTLIFAVGVAHFGNQVREHLRQWRLALENASVGLLLLLGTGTALGWIVP